MKLFLILIFLILNLGISSFALGINDTKLPKGKVPAQKLYVADTSTLGIEEQIFFSSVQGIIAQKQPRIYLLRDYEKTNDTFWQDYYIKKGYVKSFENLKDPYDLLKTFKNEIKGAVITDKKLPSTVNIATMIAGVYGYAVCTEEIAKKTNLPIKMDLRDKFKTNNEAYGWAIDNLYSKLNKTTICSLEPTHAGGWLRDYLVQHKIFTFWVQSPKADDLYGYTDKDEEFMQKILKEKFPENTPVLGFWHSGPYDEGITEYGGLVFAGKSAKYSVVYDWAANTSVHSGIKVSYDKFKQKKAKKIEYDPSKTYVMLTQYESGDAPWYWMRVQFKDWQQKSKGTFAMNWCLGPLTVDLIPAVLEWHYEQATEDDYFFVSMSGIGYTMVQYFATEVENKEKTWKTFLDETSLYMKRLDLDMISLHTDAWGAEVQYSDSKYIKRYTDNIPYLNAVLADFGRLNSLDPKRAIEKIDNTDILLIHTLNQWNFEGDQSAVLAQNIKDNKDTANGFMSILALSWTNKPDTIKKAIDMLGDEYVFVRADQFVDIYNQSLAYSK